MKKTIVSVSGGKDSTATLLLALERHSKENVVAVFADTGNEHTMTYDYLTYLENRLDITIDKVKADFSEAIENKKRYIREHWKQDGVSAELIQIALETLIPSGNPFLDLCLWKGRFPSSQARFCTQELKTYPLNEYAMNLRSQDHLIEAWQGVRADESISRSKYPERERIDDGIEIYRPILKWTASDVFAFLKQKDVDPNPLYKLGQGRVGCMPCINSRKNEIAEIAKRFPKEIERIAQWEKIVGRASKRSASTFFSCSSLNEVAYEKGNIYKVVEWSMGPNVGRALFPDFEDDERQCSSIYGLCE